MALQFQGTVVPFGGLSQRQDARAASPPNVDVCLDAQFDEVSGIQTRKPYTTLSNNIFGGGTLSNVRKLAAYDGELLCWTVDSLYSWSAAESSWVLKATDVAPKVVERTVFNSPGDQHDCDRAELGGVVWYAWAEYVSTGSQVFLAAADVTTGAVLLSPTRMSNGAFTQSARPRLVALATRVLLFSQTGSDSDAGALIVYALNPAAPSSITTTGTVIAAGTYGQVYDVTQWLGNDTAVVVSTRHGSTASYDISKVTSALAVSTVNKARTTQQFSLAVSSSPSGTSFTVCRSSAGTILADTIVASSLADGGSIGVNLGNTTTANGPNYITACHRSVQVGGQWTCYVAWNQNTTPPSVNVMSMADNGVTGSALASPPYTFGLSSRACDINGRVYFWCIFQETTGNGFSGTAYSLQNTHFLYRDDLQLCAKATTDAAGAYQSAGRLPALSVTAAGAYAFCDTTARLISLGSVNQSSFAARAPIDILVTLDSNEARRTARLGKTLYKSGGEVMQYDGTALVECGFHVYPWSFLPVMAGSGGSLSAGTYAYKFTFRSANFKGETERSTTATTLAVTAAANDKAQIIGGNVLAITHRASIGSAIAPSTSPVACEVWRTAVNPVATAPFFLVTSKDPTVLTNPNRYLNNDPTLSGLPQFNDQMADTTATTLEANPENNATLACLAPPPASIIAATEDRIFLSGISNDPDRVWYSRQRNDGEVASFNDALTFAVPRDGGNITAVTFTADGTCIVFRQRATYAFPGQGFDNLGGGNNYGPARTISVDLGCGSAEAVALTEMGLLFKSDKGWYMLGNNLALQYVGAAVYDYDGEAIFSTVVMTAQQQVRIVTQQRVLVFDYNVGQWFEWGIGDALDACLWNGQYVYLSSISQAPKVEATFATSTGYGMDVETAWIKPTSEQEGECRVRWVMPLGEYRSACALRVRIARDYQYDGSGNAVWFDDKTWNVTPTVVGGPLQLRIGPSQQKCEAMKIRLTVVSAAVPAFLALAQVDGVVNTVVQARILGVIGNTYTMTMTGDLVSGSPTISETATDVAIHFWPNHTTVAQLESLITLSSTLLSVKTPSPNHQASTIPGTSAFTKTSLAGGVAAGGAPTGESVKLTGIGIEYGVKPGLYKRLPAGQKA